MPKSSVFAGSSMCRLHLRFWKASIDEDLLIRFRAFGIQDLDHMDILSSEGATIIHDLNIRVPEMFSNRFDLVLDNGTVEHIFNLPEAFENCARLCKVGGHVVIVSPANNLCGHGFFQLSPELFFRAFCD